LLLFAGSEILTSECNGVYIITASPVPVNSRFESSFGGKIEPLGRWLTEKAVSYLRSDKNSVVLFEDPISSSSDPYLRTREHPSFWEFDGRIFWPVLSADANAADVERIKSWAAGFRDIVFFSKAPPSLISDSGTRLLSREQFSSLAAAFDCIITDIFHGEGYIEWGRRQKR
jgi:hypothetical protein